MKLEICHLYPDVLNLYGDRGNIICIKKRLEWRGIEANVTELKIGGKRSLSDFDLIFAGGGQDFDQQVLLADLAGGMAAELKSAVNDGKVVLAICGGYQMLGNYYKASSGLQCDFAGAIDVHTVGVSERMTGDIMFECTPECGGSLAIGFENHSGRTYLGSGVAPLGTVRRGFGNNGEDGTEGARWGNVFGSYAHGPLLPKNPKLADFILSLSLSARYPGLTLAELDDTRERNAHTYMTARLS